MINATDSVNVANVQGTNNLGNPEQQKTGLISPFPPTPGFGIPIVFTTENGHRIILPPQNIGGEKISINRIGPDQYLVVTERPVYGSKPKYEIYTEEELVAKYGSNKRPQIPPPVLHTKA